MIFEDNASTVYIRRFPSEDVLNNSPYEPSKIRDFKESIFILQ